VQLKSCRRDFLPESRVSRVPTVSDRNLTAGLDVYFAGYVHNAVAEID
jgi:hypothetical protein